MPIDPAIIAFHKALPQYAPTALIPLPFTDNILKLNHVLVKAETNRFGLPAFKILGASWATHTAIVQRLNLASSSSVSDVIHALRTSGAPPFAVMCATEGNHGRAVARMARTLGIPATIYLSDRADQVVHERLWEEGATIVDVAGDYDAAVAQAFEDSKVQNGLLIQDMAFPGYDDIPKFIVDGYSTIFVEVAEQLLNLHINGTTQPDIVIVPVGVGSLAESVVRYYRITSPSTRIISVKPDVANCLEQSLRIGRLNTIETGRTIMAGLNCATPSSSAWEVLKDGIHMTISVSDAEAHTAVQAMHGAGIRAGPCGAASLAALHRICSSADSRQKAGIDENTVVVLLCTEGERPYEIL
ncbi:diaminopropionate ammonia-lyase [Hymenopellis radicata]|nr:diaminopropionate ammonia-lyase [Hymenopellis radicata]